MTVHDCVCISCSNIYQQDISLLFVLLYKEKYLGQQHVTILLKLLLLIDNCSQGILAD